MAVPNESSEDVNDFLQRIRELGERRDKEDDERTKKLEEEILQGRKERQARRAGTYSLFPLMQAMSAGQQCADIRMTQNRACTITSPYRRFIHPQYRTTERFLYQRPVYRTPRTPRANTQNTPNPRT